jgi:transposase-like protein
MTSGRHFPMNVVLTCVPWHLRCKVSYRVIEELMAERGAEVDHATVNRWVVKRARLLLAEPRRHKSIRRPWW